MNSECFLVDTSAWIFALRLNPLEAIRNRISDLLNKDAIVVVEIIKLELLGGTRTEKEFARLKTRLHALNLVSIGDRQWEKAYELAFLLKRKGLTIPYTDVLIAACALTSGATILHADIHFELMKPYISLQTESYIEAIS